MHELVWSAELLDALADLPDAAEIAVMQQAQDLRRFPGMYPAARDPRMRGRRRMLVRGRYAVYYRVEAERCVLLEIVDVRSSVYRG